MNKNVKEVKSIDHVGCWTDRFITDDDTIYLMSLFGSSTRVNTLKAIILKGEPVYLQDCWTWKNRSKVQRVHGELKSMTRQLARGVAHCLLYAPDYLLPEGDEPQKIFSGDSMEQIFEKFFYAAQTRYTTPLLPAWTEWLWEQMDQAEAINALGFNLAIAIRFIDECDLEERLFETGSPLGAGDIAMNG